MVDVIHIVAPTGTSCSRCGATLVAPPHLYSPGSRVAVSSDGDAGGSWLTTRLPNCTPVRISAREIPPQRPLRKPSAATDAAQSQSQSQSALPSNVLGFSPAPSAGSRPGSTKKGEGRR